VNLEVVSEGLAGNFIKLVGIDSEYNRAFTKIDSLGDRKFEIEGSERVGCAFSTQDFGA
jgi:hypothetical protein